MFRHFLAALLLWTGLAHAAPDLAPDALAKKTTEDVLAVLRADKAIQGGDVNRAYALVEAKVLPNFDFNRMTQLAMGKNWPRASAQQKQQLVAEFRNLLVRTYASSLTRFSNQVVTFKPLAAGADTDDVTVRSQILQPNGQAIPVDYSMYRTAFGWKVYDVTIENVSLVTNYRASFAATIRAAGIDGLISQLAQQSQKAGRSGT